MIGAVQPEKVTDWWPLLTPFIAPALEYDHGTLTLDSVKDAIAAGDFACLVSFTDDYQVRACLTCEVCVEPTGKRILNMVTTAGHDLPAWQDEMLEAVEGLAREAGCAVMQTRGRMGWLKQLKSAGFSPIYFIAEKEIRDGQQQEQEHHEPDRSGPLGAAGGGAGGFIRAGQHGIRPAHWRTPAGSGAADVHEPDEPRRQPAASGVPESGQPELHHADHADD